MILITGAAGKTGRAVIRALQTAGKGQNVRALIRSPEQAQGIKAMGVEDVFVADMRCESDLKRVVTKGIHAVYHICPNMSPDEIEIGKNVIQAAVRVEVGHFVYHSVLHPQIEGMLHHWQKMRVEELLFKSNLPYTILQPAAYMQNILSQWKIIVEQGIYSVPYAAETCLGMVDLEDVAFIAAKVLDMPEHFGAIYELAGADVLSQTAVTEIITKTLSRPVVVQVTPRLQWEQRMREVGLSTYAIENLLKMFEYYEKFGFSGNPNVLSWLLNHTPTSFEQFIEKIIRSSN